MGYMMALGLCFVCKRMFSFNPRLVPSYKGEPVCRDCMGTVNRRRQELGHEPFTIHEDAYAPEEAP